MAAEGFDTFIEVGAGNTLQKLVTQILPECTAFCVENMEGLQTVLDTLR
jgi:[acyl-carrier-protein] S-malonyltransferase